MDKEFLYREILNMIRGLDCYFDYHQLHTFVIDDNKKEFRLGGKFGFGFKIYKNSFNEFWFGQYPEDETEESKIWIQQHNEHLKKMCSIE